MMWDGHGTSAWGLAFMTVNMVLFWAVIILAIVALVRYLGRTADRSRSRESSRVPEELLAERYARGEIDEEEYSRRLRALSEQARGR